MQETTKPTSRKKFLLWGTVLLSSATVFRFFAGKKKKKEETVKMLTQDGKLVEIDLKMIQASKRSLITDQELKGWVKNN
jgi:predicted sulfurtransferase